MSLEALPAELISRVCSSLGLESADSVQDQPIINHLSDFQSLRSTCKELYRKTEYNAALRYADQLWRTNIYLERQSLCGFLAICKISSFRDRVHEVHLGSRDPHHYDNDESHFELPEDMLEQDMRSSNSVHASSDTTSSEAERHQQTVSKEICQPIDFLDDRQASSEVYQLMPEFFRTLNGAKNLSNLILQADSRCDEVFDGLVAAKFTRKIVELIFNPHDLSTAGPQSRWNSLQTFANCVQSLQLNTKNISLYERKVPRAGVHIQNFRPTTPQLTRFLLALTGIEDLQLLGCRSSPELRLCHGCDDLFARNFAPMRYPHLKRLRIDCFFISGGRLRAFLKHHAQTLRDIDFNYVTLTDGSWRSIAQGLAKLPLITTLYLEHLQQKHRSDRHERSYNRSSVENVFVRNTANVRSFLEMFVEHFRTVDRFSRSRVARRYPMYHEVMLFEMLEAPMSQ